MRQNGFVATKNSAPVGPPVTQQSGHRQYLISHGIALITGTEKTNKSAHIELFNRYKIGSYNFINEII
jgi:hypothetical protein